MRFLLDTCVLSEVVKPDPHPSVLRWLEEQEEARLYLSVLVLGEIRKGIEKLSSSKRKTRLETWLDEDLRQRFEGRIWPISEKVALAWGGLQGYAERQGRRLPVIDSLLAATAEVHGAVLVTRNVADLKGSSTRLFNPWAEAEDLG